MNEKGKTNIKDIQNKVQLAITLGGVVAGLFSAYAAYTLSPIVRRIEAIEVMAKEIVPRNEIEEKLTNLNQKVEKNNLLIERNNALIIEVIKDR